MMFYICYIEFKEKQIDSTRKQKLECFNISLPLEISRPIGIYVVYHMGQFEKRFECVRVFGHFTAELKRPSSQRTHQQPFQKHKVFLQKQIIKKGFRQLNKPKVKMITISSFVE